MIATRLGSEKESKLLDLVRREREYSFMTVINKRQEFRNQDKLLNDVSNKDKIDLKTIFYLTKTLLSLHYADKPTITVFPNEQSLVGEEKAKNCERIIEHDARVMRLAEIVFDNQTNRIQRGVGIRFRNGWDDVLKCPRWAVVDPRQWFPDPRGWFYRDGFQFHGFEYTVDKDDLSEDEGYFDLEKVGQVESTQEMLNRFNAEQAAKLNPFTMDRDPSGRNRSVYHHFTKFDGEKYLVTLADDCTRIIRIMRLEPVYKAEKKDHSRIPFPVVLNYYHPQKYNPYGVSLVDLLQDKHRYKNVLANLMFIREKDMALGDDVLYDTNVIKNRNDLTSATLSRKFIGADGRGGNIQNAVAIIPKNPASGSTQNMVGLLDQWAQTAVSIDPRTMGISGGQAVTATESQQLQANSNLRTLFEAKINNIGEIDFWKEHLRGYLENMGASEEKVVRVTNSFGSQLKKLTTNDIISDTDPDMEVVSKAELQNEIDRKKANLTPLLMAVMNDPNRPQASKDSALRKMFELNDISKEETYLFAQPSAEELDARDLVPLLNMNIMDAATIDPTKMDVDHATYIAVFQKALPTEAREKAIEARKRAIIEMGQHKPQASPDAQNFNAMAASQMIGQSQQMANLPANKQMS